MTVNGTFVTFTEEAQSQHKCSEDAKELSPLSHSTYVQGGTDNVKSSGSFVPKANFIWVHLNKRINKELVIL